MKLLERVVLVCRRRGLLGRTADAYSLWIRHFLRFSAAARGEWTSPQALRTADVEAFLNHLIADRRLSASSQNQALNALVFLYTHVLEAGYDVRQVQTLLGHASLKTTMVYVHVMNKPAVAVASPLDRLAGVG